MLSYKIFGILAAGSLTLAATASAADKTCEVKIDGNDAMQFSSKELSVAKDCTDIKVTLKHVGKLPKAAMGHNLVITADKDMAAIVAAGAQAGVANEYVPKADKRIVASTKIVGGGEEASTTFKASALKAGESYKFFCTFPGHSAMMNGSFAVK